jgi:hypothetical protein
MTIEVQEQPMSLITHLRQDNNVHELAFTEASRRSTDQLITILADFYRNPQSESIYLLLDMRDSGMLPLRYLTLEMRRLNEEYLNHAPIYIALVVDDVSIIEVTSVLMRTIMRRDSAQYFTNIDKARLWLDIEQRKQ